MHWKTKAHGLAILSRIPGGKSLYHWLQYLSGSGRLQIRRDLDRAFELVELVQSAGGTFRDAEVLEIGTGWRPVAPFLASLIGARRVITLDVNPWLTWAYARETWLALRPYLDEIADRAGENREEVVDRYQQVNPDRRDLCAFLSQARVDYRYPADARQTSLPENSIDIVFSSNVLEHIPWDIQLDIHRESNRVLRPSGWAVHRFNPQDHYSLVDSTITHGNFLRYSTQEWIWYGGSGLAYHNRLRAPDYLDLFHQAGLEIDTHRARVDQPTLDAITSGRLPVHPEFQRYSPEELAIDYMWMTARKGNDSRKAQTPGATFTKIS